MFSGSTRQLLHLLSINRVSYKLRSMIWKRLNIKTPQHWNHLTLKPLNIETTQKLLNEEFSLYVGNASNLGIFLIRFSKNLFHRLLHCWVNFSSHVWRSSTITTMQQQKSNHEIACPEKNASFLIFSIFGEFFQRFCHFSSSSDSEN